MGLYYDLIMEPTKGSFPQYFNDCWANVLDNIEKPYADAIQLRIGNQLRPKLTCWGASLNTDDAKELNFPLIAEIAVYIEMLHKASIIIDDILDNDDARHHQKTFHMEFGRDKAFLFALALLGKAVSGINIVFKNTNNHFQCVDLFSNTIYLMALGGLSELELDLKSRFDIDRIRKIIKFETITLIKNSFMLGYWSTSNGQSVHEETILEIGNNCGYIFQILNDLEPFSSSKKNIAYKGNFNIDIDRDRKNIVVAYIFGAASLKEQRELQTTTGDEAKRLILKLYHKYMVYDEICNEAKALAQETQLLIVKMKSKGTRISCLNDFSKFVDEMIDMCFSKLL